MAARSVQAAVNYIIYLFLMLATEFLQVKTDSADKLVLNDNADAERNPNKHATAPQASNMGDVVICIRDDGCVNA